MDARRQQTNGPLQSQQFPPLLQHGGGNLPRLPLPLPHPNAGFSLRPTSFSGPIAGQKRSNRSSDSGGFAKLFVASLPRNISEDEQIVDACCQQGLWGKKTCFGRGAETVRVQKVAVDFVRREHAFI